MTKRCPICQRKIMGFHKLLKDHFINEHGYTEEQADQRATEVMES